MRSRYAALTSRNHILRGKIPVPRPSVNLLSVGSLTKLRCTCIKRDLSNKLASQLHRQINHVSLLKF